MVTVRITILRHFDIFERIYFGNGPQHRFATLVCFLHHELLAQTPEYVGIIKKSRENYEDLHAFFSRISAWSGTA